LQKIKPVSTPKNTKNVEILVKLRCEDLIPMQGKPKNRKAIAIPLVPFKAAIGIDVTVRVELAVEFPGVSVVGFRAQVVLGGAPEQVSAIDPGKPPEPGLMVTEEVAGRPATNDKLAGVALMVKSVTATAIGPAVVEGLKVISPAYAAVIECVPVPRFAREKLAVPLDSVEDPRAVPPSKKATLPVGVPPVPETVAVIVAVAPGNI
jgi:hypothetical protein